MRCTAPRKGCARSSSSDALRAARRGPARRSRTTSASRAASPAPTSRAARPDQAKRFGAEIITAQEVVEIRREDPYRKVILGDGSELTGYALLIAPGMEVRQLPAEGIEPLLGAGVYYGSSLTEAATYRGQDVIVVGGANSAGQGAMFFSPAGPQGHDPRARTRPSGRDVELPRGPHSRDAERRSAGEHQRGLRARRGAARGRDGGRRCERRAAGAARRRHVHLHRDRAANGAVRRAGDARRRRASCSPAAT